MSIMCAIQNGSVHCYGEDGRPGIGVLGLYEDRQGNLWAGVVNGIWRWKPGASNFYPIPDTRDTILSFAEDNDGALVFGTNTETKRFADGKIEPFRLPGGLRQARASTMLRDRDGGLWIGTLGAGLLHVHEGGTDAFTQPDGLSGNDVQALFEDHEGN